MVFESLWLTVAQAADLLGVRPALLARWIGTGVLPRAEPGGRESLVLLHYPQLLCLRLAVLLRRDYKVPLDEIRRMTRWLEAAGAAAWHEARVYVAGHRLFFEDPRTAAIHSARRPEQMAFDAVLDLREVEANFRSHLARFLTQGKREPGSTSRTRGVVGGVEVFSGTRIPVGTIMRWIQAGSSDAEVLANYPSLSVPDIAVARARLAAGKVPERYR
jgi:hypothetical protein